MNIANSKENTVNQAIQDKKFKTKTIKFGDLKPGDKIIGSDGKPTLVTQVYDKHFPNKMFEIEMEDGEVVRASGNHLWYCETNSDNIFKDEYWKLAKDYFENFSIPDRLEEDGHFPLPILMQLFDDRISIQLFIEKAAKSLGYSSYTPIISQEIMKNREIVEFDNETVFNYSYNDLIDFLHKTKKAVLKNQGYFYFGQVRTTEEIANIIGNGGSINIPHKDEINNG